MTKRLNVVLPESTMNRLEKIKMATSVTSYTEVIRTALLTYEALVEHVSKGDAFFFRKPNENTYIPLYFLFDVANEKNDRLQAAE